jgi:hypothetical protein
MSISLVSAPGNYQPAYNPIVWKFSSTNVNECDFEYLCDVYINGDFAVRLKAFPNESDDYGYFQIERVIQDYLSFNFQPTITDFAVNPLGAVTYYIQIREKFNSSNDCTGVSTISVVHYTSTEKISWNGALSYHEYLSYTQTQYVLTGRQSRFLTKFKSKIKVGINDYFTLSFIQGSTRVERMSVETYGSDDTIIDTYYLTNTYNVITSPAVDGDYHLTVGVGPENLNNTTFDGSPAPSQPVISGSVEWYRVRMLDVSDNILSEAKDFIIDSSCYKFRLFRFWWLNRLGDFDSWNFNLKSTRRADIVRTLYTKFLESTYTAVTRGEGVTNVDGRDSMFFTSDWLTQDEAAVLEELFTSPEVYVYNNTPIKQKVEITGAAYNAGLIDLVLPPDVFLATGTTFTYAVTNGDILGMENSGSGTITGFNNTTGYHTTDIPASINAGALITGYLSAETENSILIPLVITSNTFEEKIKDNEKLINYTIEAKPSYKHNVQSL